MFLLMRQAMWGPVYSIQSTSLVSRNVIVYSVGGRVGGGGVLGEGWGETRADTRDRLFQLS